MRVIAYLNKHMKRYWWIYVAWAEWCRLKYRKINKGSNIKDNVYKNPKIIEDEQESKRC